MNSICDDKLVTMISSELAHVGLIVPVSEIENSVIKVYDNIQKAYEADNTNKTVDCYIKDDRYYGTLKYAACAEILSKVRLTKARNGYEAASVLAILQGYLDSLSEAAGTVRTIAPEVFKDILEKLPGVSIISINQLPQQNIACPQPYPLGLPPVQLMPLPVPMLYGSKPKELKVCTNSIERHNCEICSACEGAPEYESCGDSVSLSIMLKGMCYGVKLPPETLGLHELLYKNDLPDKVNIFKNKIGVAARLLKKHAEEIFIGLYGAYHNQEDENDD